MVPVLPDAEQLCAQIPVLTVISVASREIRHRRRGQGGLQENTAVNDKHYLFKRNLELTSTFPTASWKVTISAAIVLPNSGCKIVFSGRFCVIRQNLTDIFLRSGRPQNCIMLWNYQEKNCDVRSQLLKAKMFFVFTGHANTHTQAQTYTLKDKRMQTHKYTHICKYINI